MSRVLGRAEGPADGLRRLLGSYTDFAFEFPAVVHLLITEIVQLPADQQHRMRAAQHDYIAEWVYLVRSVHPDWDPTNARIRVHAALNMINDIALTPHLHRYQNLAPSLIDIGTHLLNEPIWLMHHPEPPAAEPAGGPRPTSPKNERNRK